MRRSSSPPSDWCGVTKRWALCGRPWTKCIKALTLGTNRKVDHSMGYKTKSGTVCWICLYLFGGEPQICELGCSRPSGARSPVSLLIMNRLHAGTCRSFATARLTRNLFIIQRYVRRPTTGHGSRKQVTHLQAISYPFRAYSVEVDNEPST